MPVTPDQIYFSFLERILKEGEKREDRTQTGTLSLFNHEMSFDIKESCPFLTTKRVHFPSVIHELLWFISGDTNVRYLQENKVRIWNEWADEHGDLGPVYGKQWRYWPTRTGHVDQLAEVISNIQTDPYSRRHIVSAWNVGALQDMALPPCHLLFQFYVTGDGHLNCKLFQRSADAFLGVPFNIASYSVLTYLIAQQCGLKPGTFVWSGTDCHIYLNHLDAVSEQLTRSAYASPTLIINPKPSIDDYTFEDFTLLNYQHHPAIKAPIAV